jgi:hypothetical protein
MGFAYLYLFTFTFTLTFTFSFSFAFTSAVNDFVAKRVVLLCAAGRQTVLL